MNRLLSEPGRVGATLALGATVLLWTGFALSASTVRTTSLLVSDAALLRFGIPLVAAVPLIVTTGRWRSLRNSHTVLSRHSVFIILGAGLPFFVASVLGASLTSAVFVGAIIPGLSPLFVAIILVLGGARRPRGRTLVGYFAIVSGVVFLVVLLVGAKQPSGARFGPLLGCVLLVLASACWALYTVGLRAPGFDPVNSIVVLCLPSFLVTAIAIALHLVPSDLVTGAARWPDIVQFSLVQGVGIGLFAGILYSTAIRRFGAGRSAVVGSATPALTAIASVPILGQALTPGLTVAVGVVCVGVALSALPGRRSGRSPRTRHHVRRPVRR